MSETLAFGGTGLIVVGAFLLHPGLGLIVCGALAVLLSTAEDYR